MALASGCRIGRRAAFVALLMAALVVVPIGPASAHPLGNFTINHYNGLVLSPDSVSNTAVVDSAEIPTLQERDTVDANQDTVISTDERAAFAADQCLGLAGQLDLRIDGSSVPWSVVASSFTYRAGAAGLDVSRLQCSLDAEVDLQQAAAVSFEDHYLADRIGWREITATGDGLDLGNREVAKESISDELRSYPNDLLSSPPDQRSLQLQTRPGIDAGSANLPELPEAGLVASFLNSMTSRLDSLVANRDLTLGVGLLAILLALVLGVSHAAMPGHGKTLMAAYMVGTRGSPKDAVLIAATVTATHTAGVLVLGLLLSASASFAGEVVLAVLGLVSGLLVASVGIVLVRAALLRRNRGYVDDLWGHGHGHGHDHGHPHDHGHDHHHSHSHDHGHVHDHSAAGIGVSTVVLEHDRHRHEQPREPSERGYKRLTLVGMGLAGGLVPSPSALIVLLGAIGLGRTVFGVALVLVYGIGMAITLTTVGYLIAKLPGRLSRVRALTRHAWIMRIAAAAPLVTAVLVLAVGVGLTLRSVGPLL